MSNKQRINMEPVIRNVWKIASLSIGMTENTSARENDKTLPQHKPAVLQINTLIKATLSFELQMPLEKRLLLEVFTFVSFFLEHIFGPLGDRILSCKKKSL